jgi:hypothetical protein
MKRGLTDLFVYDLTTTTLRQLTSDAYADLQPAWSPDGTRIAFATDRFSSDLAALAMGPYRLALIDPQSGAVQPLEALPAGKHLDPQWSPDGQALYFISDQVGLPNIYRLTLASGELAQVTKIGTGVSGITSGSPAMSVASRSGTIAFNVYESGKYNIYTLDAPIESGPVTALTTNAAVLPPLDREQGAVATVLADVAFGLPDSYVYPSVPYKAKLSLEAAGPPMAGVGVSRFGPTIGGGISLYFGDMLENHLLSTAVGLNTGWTGSVSGKDVAAEAAYLNRERRWNWGVVGAQIPYLSGGFRTAVGLAPNGDLLKSDQLITFRQTEQSASGVVAYPLNRARRVEFQGGLSHISFEQVVNTTTYSLLTGIIYENTTQTITLASPLTIGTSSAAYVFDTSSFGATSPVQGQRYRFEADPTFGTINFTGLLADYRRYMMPVPFYTVAMRAMHYGRYGSGGEDPRLYPVDIGYPGLVRGYDVTTVTTDECRPTAKSTCPVIDGLLGSRMLIGNVELRFPLLRPFGVSRNMYGPVPVEVAVFSDIGTAWTTGEKPSWFGGSRGGVASAGVTLRVNLLGFAVGQFDFARPFQRPGRGWIFAFNFLQGW